MRMVFNHVKIQKQLPEELNIPHEGISFKRNCGASTVLGVGGSEIQKKNHQSWTDEVKFLPTKIFLWWESGTIIYQLMIRHGFEQN